MAENTKSKNKLNTKKKKRFFQRPAGITLIVILVILIGGGVTAFALRDHILKAILGPVQYYIYKEGYGVYDLSDSDYSLSGDINLSGASTPLASWSGSSSSKIGVDVSRSCEDNKTQVNVDFMNFLKIDVQQDSTYYSVSINGVDFPTADTTKKKKSSSSSSKSKSEPAEKMSNFDILSWAYDFSKECISDAFPNENIIEDTKDFNGTDCDVTTFVIDSTVKRNILYRVADNLESDKTTQSLFKKAYEEIYGSISILYGVNAGDFIVNESAKTMREIATEIESDDSKILYSVYYDGGNIVNRVYTADDQDITLSTYEGKEGDVLSFDFSGACAGNFAVKDSANLSNLNLKKDKDNAVTIEELMTDLGDLSIGKLLGFDSIVPQDEIREGSIFDDMVVQEESTTQP